MKEDLECLGKPRESSYCDPVGGFSGLVIVEMTCVG
jgi:hypothetical protein